MTNFGGIVGVAAKLQKRKQRQAYNEEVCQKFMRRSRRVNLPSRLMSRWSGVLALDGPKKAMAYC
jgi:hypothetical protein